MTTITIIEQYVTLERVFQSQKGSRKPQASILTTHKTNFFPEYKRDHVSQKEVS